MNNFEKQNEAISLKSSALIAGISLLLMAVIAPIADMGILQKIFIPGDPAKTFENMVTSEGLFRLVIMIFIIVALLDIIIAWALYIFLSPVNRLLSLLAAWFRVVYAAILIFLLIYLLEALILINGADYSTAFSPDFIQNRVMFCIDIFLRGWEFALIIFGFHLLLLGYLLFRAGFMKKYLGILIFISGLGYITDGAGRILSEGYDLKISIYTFIGELVLIFWLLIQGRKIK